MIRHAIVNTSIGEVVNVVEYETAPETAHAPGYPDDHIAVPHPRTNIGDRWDGKQIICKPEREPAAIAPPPPAHNADLIGVLTAFTRLINMLRSSGAISASQAADIFKP